MSNKLEDLPGPHFSRAYVPGQATAGTADEWPVFRAPGAVKIRAVRWIPAAAVTGAATNNFALQAINRGTANGGSTGVTQTKTYASGTNSAANTPEALTLSATAADLNLASGEVLALARTINGTGLAMPDGQLEVEYEYR